MLDQPTVYFNDVGDGNRQTDHLSEAHTQPIVHEHSGVLWVVKEFDHIVIAISAVHEMTLRASVHPANIC